MESLYKPDVWLGILKSDKLYFDFFSPNIFDKSFKELIGEIESIKARSKTHPNHTTVLRSDNNNQSVQMNNQIMRDQFNTIIREYKELINKNDYDLYSFEKEELCELIKHLQEQFFNGVLSTFDNDNKNCEQKNLDKGQVLCELFEQSRNQTECLRNITEILSKLSGVKTMIKLSLTFLFMWTAKDSYY